MTYVFRLLSSDDAGCGKGSRFEDDTGNGGGMRLVRVLVRLGVSNPGWLETMSSSPLRRASLPSDRTVAAR